MFLGKYEKNIYIYKFFIIFFNLLDEELALKNLSKDKLRMILEEASSEENQRWNAEKI